MSLQKPIQIVPKLVRRHRLKNHGPRIHHGPAHFVPVLPLNQRSAHDYAHHIRSRNSEQREMKKPCLREPPKTRYISKPLPPRHPVAPTLSSAALLYAITTAIRPAPFPVRAAKCQVPRLCSQSPFAYPGRYAPSASSRNQFQRDSARMRFSRQINEPSQTARGTLVCHCHSRDFAISL